MARSSGSAVARLLAQKGINPFVEMAKLAQDPEIAPATRAYLWVQLARYCAPQLRSILLVQPKKSPGKDAVKRAKQAVFGFIGDE